MHLSMILMASPNFKSWEGTVPTLKTKKNKTTMRTTNNLNANTVEAHTANQVMDKIVKIQPTLKKDIKFLNFKYGSKLSKKEQDEILATVTFKALENAEGYDASKANLRTWMNTIARNEILTVLKERDRSAARSILYIDESDDEGRFSDEIRQMHYRLDEVEMKSTGIMGKERARETLLKVECLKDAIHSLSDRDQSVIFMLIDGFSGREMADVLQVKEGAQRKLVSDVRGRLKRRLAEAQYADIAERTDRYRNSAVKWDAENDEEFGFLYASRSEMND